jgi:hypothetical protein
MASFGEIRYFNFKIESEYAKFELSCHFGKINMDLVRAQRLLEAIARSKRIQDMEAFKETDRERYEAQ